MHIYFKYVRNLYIPKVSPTPSLETRGIDARHRFFIIEHNMDLTPLNNCKCLEYLTEKNVTQIHLTPSTVDIARSQPPPSFFFFMRVFFEKMLGPLNPCKHIGGDDYNDYDYGTCRPCCVLAIGPMTRPSSHRIPTKKANPQQ